MRSPHASSGAHISKYVKAMALALAVIVVTAAAAFGDLRSASEEPVVSDTEEIVASTNDETVTMAIDLDEGGTIDLDMGRGDVVIDTWEGNEVLVIVDKKKARADVSQKPISFKVSRLGNNVRIAALDEYGKRVFDSDFSFRIMVPRDRYGNGRPAEKRYDLTKLTSVVFKALHREAIHWLTR